MTITSIYVSAGHTLVGAEKFEFVRIDAGVTVTLEPGETPADAAKRVQPDLRRMLEETYKAQKKGARPAGSAPAQPRTGAPPPGPSSPTTTGHGNGPVSFQPAGGPAQW